MKRMVVVAAGLFAVLLLQLTIVNGLPLPGGGVPDLVLLCVVSLGLIAGPRAGLVAGFFAGLALDLAPPASELMGQYALVLCVAGYLGGRMRFTLRQSALLAITVAAVAAAVGEVLSAALSLVLDSPQVTPAIVARVLPSSVFYDAVLSPLVLFAGVQIAVALGVSFSVLDDSPATESGGSAAPAARGATGRAGGQRVRLGSSRSAAGGRWLIGGAEDAPAIGAVGWLAGPARSRRARREQARLSATLTGASPHKGSFWVGSRPPGLLPVAPPPAASRRDLSLLRLRSGVAGSAAAFEGLSWRPGQSVHAGHTPARSSRPVRLGLAAERRRRAKASSRWGRAFGRSSPGRLEAGLDQHGVDRHGISGPGVRRFAFGSGGPAGSGSGGAAGRVTPRIAFGSGGLPGSGSGGAAGGAAGRATPRIAFGTGGLPGSGSARAGGRATPRIAFGSGGLPGSGSARAAGRATPRIAFGSGGLPGSGSARAAGRATPRIAFGTGGLPGSGSRATGKGTKKIRFGTGGPTRSRRTATRKTPRIGFGTSGTDSKVRPVTGLAQQALTSSRSSFGGTGLPDASHAGITTGPRRRSRRPRFGREASGYGVRRVRQPKTARMRAGHWPLRRLSWLRRAGGRSAVWRIGTMRTGGYR